MPIGFFKKDAQNGTKWSHFSTQISPLYLKLIKNRFPTQAREALEHVIKTVIHPEKHLMGFAPRPSQSRAADPKPAERQ
jgi:hypothetical protein